MTNKKGFTLIELLVVVAIIGILATVVLASLGQARTRAKDAAIKSAVSQARAEFELRQIDANTYVGADVMPMFTSIINQGGTAIYPSPTATEYVFGSDLLSNDNYFCIDETGVAVETATLPTDATTGCGVSI